MKHDNMNRVYRTKKLFRTAIYTIKKGAICLPSQGKITPYINTLIKEFSHRVSSFTRPAIISFGNLLSSTQPRWSKNNMLMKLMLC